MAKRTRNRFISLLRREIGYYEKASNACLDDKTANAGSNNFTKYARDLANAGYYQASKQGFDWCDVFYDWVFLQLCDGDANEAQRRTCQSGPYGAGVDWSASYYKQQDRFYTRNPMPGDQVFFNDYAHTGAVEEVTQSQIITIEGNANNRVERRYYSINDYRIDGFGRPDFDEEVEKDFSEAIRGVYKVTANGGLNLRSDYCTDGNIKELMPLGSCVRCYGYFTGEWYYVQSEKGNTGYCHKDYLERVMPFVDVSPTAYYFDAVLWALEQGVVSGTSKDLFSPEAVCTRAQAVTMLHALHDKPEPDDYEPFMDVPPTTYYAKAAQWAQSGGITAGIGENRFGGDQPCTRAQIMQMLWRSEGSPVTFNDVPFMDVAESDWFYEAVRWAVSQGVTAGVDATHFAPGYPCTRAQMVLFLSRV